MEVWVTIAVMAATFGAGFVTTVAGLGGGILLLPVLIWALGTTGGVVVLSMSMLWGNILRFIMFREHTDWDVAKRLAWGAIPGAAIGASMLNRVPEGVLQKWIAVYLLLYVAYELFGETLRRPSRLQDFPVVGFVTGVLSGMFGAAGPLSAPFLMNYGLTKERFIATNMLSALIINGVKSIVYSQGGTLTTELWGWSCLAGVMVTLGIWVGRLSLEKIDEGLFKKALLAMLCLVSLNFLLGRADRHPAASPPPSAPALPATQPPAESLH